jgi:hypothetical protein
VIEWRRSAPTCGNVCRCPRPRPSTFGRRGASIELSEACSSVGQLEARAGEGLALAPLTNRCVIARWHWRSGRLSSFLHKRWARLFGRDGSPHRVVDPPLPRPPWRRGIFFFGSGPTPPSIHLGALAACGWAAVPISASYLFRWIR